MSTPHGTLLIIGSGPGIGLSTASLFASKGFKHIILTSRDSKRLTSEAESVKKAAGGSSDIRVDTLSLDLAGDKDSVNGTLGKIDGLLKEAGSELEVVLYNGARVGPSVIGEWDVSGLEEDLRVSFFLFPLFVLFCSLCFGGFFVFGSVLDIGMVLWWLGCECGCGLVVDSACATLLACHSRFIPLVAHSPVRRIEASSERKKNRNNR